MPRKISLFGPQETDIFLKEGYVSGKQSASLHRRRIETCLLRSFEFNRRELALVKVHILSANSSSKMRKYQEMRIKGAKKGQPDYRHASQTADALAPLYSMKTVRRKIKGRNIAMTLRPKFCFVFVLGY